MKLTFVMVADLSPEAVSAFHAYESEVRALLPRHGGHLDRRLQTEDALHEVHLVSFDSQDGYESYLADDERQSYRSLLDGLDIVQRVLRVNVV